MQANVVVWLALCPRAHCSRRQREPCAALPFVRVLPTKGAKCGNVSLSGAPPSLCAERHLSESAFLGRSPLVTIAGSASASAGPGEAEGRQADFPKGNTRRTEEHCACARQANDIETTRRRTSGLVHRK